MTKLILILITTLLGAVNVQAQTDPNSPITRKQTIQKGKVLRKNPPDQKNNYQAKNGTKGLTIQRGQKTAGSSRTEPMVTKPLVPIN